ncbi:uncharacterized protein LOC113312420 [Papaver somniferum]|uniref:uncharacterized protein LOC113312420 n=1 Tax=Papaver somniferum TaxID=3469 RepID=UPI000E6F6F30|nr:uncharacterized protein LOC113312420 [Papaver somniferum]
MIQVDCAIKRTRYLQVLGSGNGLVCLKSWGENLIYVWNPSTKELKEIPKHPCQDGSYPTQYRFGFGYNSKTFPNIPFLFSSFTPNSIQQHVFLDGTLYWIIVHRGTLESISSFNIANESLQEVPPPSRDLANLELCVIRGCLYLSGVLGKGNSMSEYGARKPWTKVCNINTTFDWQEHLLHIGEILLQKWRG